MNRWIVSLEKLSKDRALAEGRERTAAEERKKLDEKLKELDGEILVGMKGWAKKEEEKIAVVEAEEKAGEDIKA
jgi:hypothetical protein